MNVKSVKPILNASLPRAFKKIRLELAREPGHPQGDPHSAYIIVAPLTSEGRLDDRIWREFREACRVVRLRPHDGAVRGHIVRTPAGRWFFHYEEPSYSDETGYHFSDERFVVNEYVSILESGVPHTFRVVSVDAL